MLLSLTTTGHLAVCKKDLSRFITLSEFTDIRKESQSQIAKAPNEIVDKWTEVEEKDLNEIGSTYDRSSQGFWMVLAGAQTVCLQP